VIYDVALLLMDGRSGQTTLFEDGVEGADARDYNYTSSCDFAEVQ